ncbi:hypothetical protein ADK41_05595 [Streptomyces caelestis]|uniref:Uncharacterized protein n=1 Tax=Streptomyces caelestis TaxID=36816 RepID=A0A0M8QLS6_9ACTN|nr:MULTISPECIES: hypothetical protein [Streptomyces]KOT43635.1 hypothetical protein ADK41_05595 [Streptomyces caelestis]
MPTNSSTTKARSGVAGSSALANRNGGLATVHTYTSPWWWAAPQKSPNARFRVAGSGEAVARGHAGTPAAGPYACPVDDRSTRSGSLITHGTPPQGTGSPAGRVPSP